MLSPGGDGAAWLPGIIREEFRPNRLRRVLPRIDNSPLFLARGSPFLNSTDWSNDSLNRG